MARISRDPGDIAAQTIGASHAYPDGFVLLLGTMFAPVADRGAPDHLGQLPKGPEVIASLFGRLAANEFLCLLGDKTGDNRWYETNVPVADRLFERHLRTIRVGEG